MFDRPLYERVINSVLIVLLLAVGLISFDRARRARYDFHHFYLDARYVWEHGELNPKLDDADPDQQRQLPFYLPVVPLVLAPLTAFGRVPAALLWSAAQVAALGYSLRVLRRWGEEGPGFRVQGSGFRVQGSGSMGVSPVNGTAFALAILLAVPAFIEAGKFNQLSYFVLALVLGAVNALDRNRARTSGLLFGAAGVLKLLPAVFVIWLVLKRRWSAAVSFVVASVLLTLLPPLLVFGPQRTIAYHRQWWDFNVRGDAARGLLNAELPGHFVDRRNQSIAQVLARLTWRGHPHAAPFQPVQLDPRTCARVAYGIMGVLLLGLMWATRRPWSGLTVERRHAEAAAYAIGMLVFSPLVRQYYLVWAVPGLLLLTRAAGSAAGPRACARGSDWRSRLGWVGLVVWLLGMVLWIWPLARELGAHLVMLIVLGVLLLLAAEKGDKTGKIRPV